MSTQNKIPTKQSLLEIELLKLPFQTRELWRFYQTKKWIEKALCHFRNNHLLRSQLDEELRNAAYLYIREQWRANKKAGRIVTGGLNCRYVRPSWTLYVIL